MYVIFLNLIKGDILINTKKILKIDFGDPIDKIHLKRSEGLKSYRFRGMTVFWSLRLVLFIDGGQANFWCIAATNWSVE